VGVNHIDVAADYGDAELRLGPWRSEIRDRVFLATKPDIVIVSRAWQQINDSLRLLRTDHLDPATHLVALQRQPFATGSHAAQSQMLCGDDVLRADHRALVGG
jgi:diketogulonate reductase-like aldo/keto reductase